MTTTKKWELNDEDAHRVALDLQRSERRFHHFHELDEVHATLYIWFSGAPEEITEELGLQPDDVTRPGDTLYDQGRWLIQSDETSWTLTSADKIESSTSEDHIQWILDQVEGKMPALKRLQAAGARTKLHVHAAQCSQIYSLDLSIEMLLQMARYNLPLTLVVNYQDDED